MNEYGYIGTVIGSVIGYLIGSISWSLIIGKSLFHKDVRNYYSKNAGATNATRVLGKKWGIAIMFLDMIKIPLVMVIAMGISAINIKNVNFGQTSIYIPGVFAIIGHCFPVFFKFKGGKGVSCFIGLSWMINPFYFIIFSVIWWSLFFIWKRVSLSSIMGALIAIALCWVPEISLLQNLTTNGSDALSSQVPWFNKSHWINYDNYADSIILINTCYSISGVALILMHYANIGRLFKGTESKFSFSSKKQSN